MRRWSPFVLRAGIKRQLFCDRSSDRFSFGGTMCGVPGHKACCLIDKISGSFPFVPPQYDMRPPVTDHVSLHRKSLCKMWHVRLGGANNMRLISWGAQTEDPNFSVLPQ